MRFLNLAITNKVFYYTIFFVFCLEILILFFYKDPDIAVQGHAHLVEEDLDPIEGHAHGVVGDQEVILLLMVLGCMLQN